MTQPIVTTAINDLVVVENAQNGVIDLLLGFVSQANLRSKNVGKQQANDPPFFKINVYTPK